MSTSSNAGPELIGKIIDEWQERVRRGQKPTIAEYLSRYPQVADELRQILPGLAAMEDLKGDALNCTVSPVTLAPPNEGTPVLDQLGDFRILREVGRGGMGVVYEAEQISLGRHVALKVLPQKLLVDARQKRRFAREAKAAAKLHHTNIVPVFGVGEHEGMPYYVMQFIQGLGLDVVLDEARRQQEGDSGKAGSAGPAYDLTVTRGDVSVADVARSLLTGEFTAGVPDSSPSTERTSKVKKKSPSGNSSDTSANRSGSATFSGSTSSVSLPGLKSGVARAKERPKSYWQTVAAIGVQVADALDHAHKQGILHRDIKPSNLLLDTRGTVWVTDFGLAKATDHHDDITSTGDVLGTLRYMPPEAFEGRSDTRSDIYSLGLTLYELLALRPAFDEKDRHQLIKQVTTKEAPRLDRIRKDVPRDLVTVIQKAIDRDPARRYQVADDLVEDLQRFIDDVPIKARRVSPVERFMRWSRHNKGLAAALSGVAVLLLVSTVVSAMAMVYFWRQEQLQGDLAEKNAQLLVAAEREREDARNRAEEQTRLTNEAEANFRLANNAVDQFLNKVTSEPILNGPGLQPLRKKLLQSSLPFFEDFIKRRSDNPALRGDLADALSRIGRLTSEIGSPQEAIGYIERAAALRDRFLQDQPSDLKTQAAQARDQEALGELYLRMSDFGKAEQALANAESIWQFAPMDAVFQSGAARTISLAGDVAWADCNTGVALEKYNRALALLTALVRQHATHPELPRFQLQLTQAMSRFADANVRLQQLEGTYSSVGAAKTPADFFREAAGILEALSRDYPKHELATAFRRELALTRERLGGFEAARGNTTAALTAYRRASETRAELARDNPLVTDYQTEWAQNLAGTARLHAESEDWEAAATTLLEAVEHQRAALRAAPESAQYIGALGRQLCDLGRAHVGQEKYSAALAVYREAADRFAALASPSREDLYAAAVAHAWTARLAIPPDVDKPTEEQKMLRQQHSTASVTALEKAIAAGFIDYKTLAAEQAFESVLADERFQKAVAGLKTKLEDWKWHEDLNDAREVARRSGKDLLIYFSGSDWCVWCIVVRKGILDREEFLREASKNYVLVILDTPRRKAPPANSATVSEMRTKWGVNSFPNFVFCDPELRRFGDFTRSRPTTIPAWIVALKGMRDQRVNRDDALAKARAADPKQRNQIIFDYFQNVPKQYHDDYGDELGLALLGNAIDKAPTDPAGYHARAMWYLQRKDWRGALTDLNHLSELNPADSMHWLRLGAAQLQAGDLEAHRKLSRVLLEKTATAPAPEAAERAVKTIAVVPCDPDTLRACAARIDALLTLEASHWIIPWAQAVKGLVEYRAGNYREAITWCDKALAAGDKRSYRDVETQLIKAMAHQQLEEHDAAYAAWAQASFTLDGWSRLDFQVILRADWHDWIFCQKLRADADAALKGNTTLALKDQARTQLESVGGWQVLKPTQLTSAGGATLTLQPDASILAGGVNPATDTYTLVAEVNLPRITAVRLEVLPDTSLPKNGPGRHVGGNFHLTDMRVTVGTPANKEPAPAPIGGAFATFEQNGLPIRNVFDDDPRSQWGLAPRVGEAHAAVFELKEPAAAGQGTKLTVTLKFNDNVWKQTALGRFRLSVSGAEGTLIAARTKAGLETDPRLPKLYTALGVVHAMQGDTAKAAEQLANALDRTTSADERLTLIDQVVGLRGVIDALVKLRPASPDLFISLARYHADRGETKQADAARARAQALYEANLAEKPDDESLAEALAGVLGTKPAPESGWTVFKPTSLKSDGGATLKLQSDGSILASGISPDMDTYTLSGHITLPRFAAVRLEVLPDASLPHGGSGRAPDNGNFALGEFRFAIGPPAEASWVIQRPANAFSNHAVSASDHHAKLNMHVGLTLDAKPETYWESFPVSKQPHWAIYRPESAIKAGPRTKFWVRLEFRTGLAKHTLGRFRLSVTGDDNLAQGTGVLGAELTGFARLGEAYASAGVADKAAAAFIKALDRAAPADRAKVLERAAASEAVVAELVKQRPNDLQLRMMAARRLAGRGWDKETEAAYAQAAARTGDELNRFLEAGWWVAGPCPADTAFLSAYSLGEVPDVSKPLPAGAATWRAIPAGNLGKIELDSILGTRPQSAYAMNYIHSPDERTATLVVGGDSLRVWLDGRSIFQVGAAKAKPGTAPPLARVPITLKAGRNVLLLKVTSGETVPVVSVRLYDAPLIRADDLARVSLWKEALAHSKRGIEASSDHHRQRMHALLLLLNDDQEGFRNYCRLLTERYGSLAGAEQASAVCHTWCLAPNPELPAAQLMELAEKATTGIQHPWPQFEVALALYRTGKFSEALAKLDAIQEIHEWPKVWVLRALAHHRLGQMGEARTWLTKAGEWYDQMTREASGASLTMPFHPGWWEQARFQLLHREARQLIEDPKWKDDNDETLQRRARAALRPETFDYDLALLLQPANYRHLMARAGRFLELKRVDDAKADFEEALKLRPKDPQIAWRDQGQIEAALGDPQRAAEALSKYLDTLQGDGWAAPRSRACVQLAQLQHVYARLIELRPQDTALALGQARLYAAMGRWAEASATLGKVIESRPLDEGWFELASFQLLAGDEAGYRKTCERYIERMKDSKEPSTLYSIARACVLAPKSPADPAQIVKWAQAAAANQTQGWLYHVHAAAHFRAGEYVEALRLLAESDKTGWGPRGRAQNALIRAMIQFKQSELGPARVSLNQGIQTMERSNSDIRNQIDLANPDWYAFQILRREAEALIEPPSDKDKQK